MKLGFQSLQHIDLNSWGYYIRLSGKLLNLLVYYRISCLQRWDYINKDDHKYYKLYCVNMQYDTFINRNITNMYHYKYFVLISMNLLPNKIIKISEIHYSSYFVIKWINTELFFIYKNSQYDWVLQPFLHSHLPYFYLLSALNDYEKFAYTSCQLRN